MSHTLNYHISLFLIPDFLFYWDICLIQSGYCIYLFIVAFLYVRSLGRHVCVTVFQNILGQSLVSVLLKFKIILSTFIYTCTNHILRILISFSLYIWLCSEKVTFSNFKSFYLECPSIMLTQGHSSIFFFLPWIVIFSLFGRLFLSMFKYFTYVKNQGLNYGSPHLPFSFSVLLII